MDDYSEPQLPNPQPQALQTYNISANAFGTAVQEQMALQGNFENMSITPKQQQMGSTLRAKRNKKRTNNNNDYRRKRIPKKVKEERYRASRMSQYNQQRPIAQSQMPGQGEDLVSEMSSLSINGRRKVCRKSQLVFDRQSAICPMGPVRRTPARDVKVAYKDGDLSPIALQKRIYRQEDKKHLKQQGEKADKMQVDERAVQVYDPNNPFALIYIDQNDKDEDIICDICLEDECEEGDEIVVCDSCNVAVHQRCYGSELLQGVPQDQWHCARCRHLHETKTPCTEIKCLFCPDIDGCMKLITAGNTQIWAHLICVNWIPEMWFTDDRRELVQGCIPKDRFLIKKDGAVINCDYKGCRKSFHVRRAARMGNIYSWEQMLEDLDNPKDDVGIPVFCHDHRAKGQLIFKVEGARGLRNHIKPRVGGEKGKKPEREIIEFKGAGIVKKIKELGQAKVKPKAISKKKGRKQTKSKQKKHIKPKNANKKKVSSTRAQKQLKIAKRTTRIVAPVKKTGVHKKNQVAKKAAEQTSMGNVQGYANQNMMAEFMKNMHQMQNMITAQMTQQTSISQPATTQSNLKKVNLNRIVKRSTSPLTNVKRSASPIQTIKRSTSPIQTSVKPSKIAVKTSTSPAPTDRVKTRSRKALKEKSFGAPSKQVPTTNPAYPQPMQQMQIRHPNQHYQQLQPQAMTNEMMNQYIMLQNQQVLANNGIPRQI